MKRILTLAAALAAGLLISAGQAVAGGYVPSNEPIDILAGMRLQTHDATVALYTSLSNGNSRVGPWHYGFRRQIPLSNLNGASSYYRCKLTFTNWAQGPGASISLSASSNASGSANINVTSTSGIFPGQFVSMTGFPAGTRVSSINSPTIVVVNQAATSTNASAIATFTSAPNYYNGGAGEIDSVGDYIILGNVSFLPVWNSGDTPIQVLFQGAKSISIPYGSTIDSDWFQVNLVPTLSQFAEERHDVWWGANSNLFGDEVMRLDLGEGFNYAAETAAVSGTSIDQTMAMSPSFTQNSAIYGWGPTGLTCTALTSPGLNRAFLIIGDSKGRGAYDSILYNGQTSLMAHGDSNGNVGWIARLLANNGYAYINGSQSSKWLANFVSNPSNILGLIQKDGITDAILALGVNDAANGQTASQIEANFQAAAALLKSVGVKVWAVTVGTETTTVDGGATAVGQTPVSGFSVGGAAQVYNDWLRSTGAPTLAGGRILDEANAEMGVGIQGACGSTCTPAQDSQVWRVDYHPFSDWSGTLLTTTSVAGSGATNGNYPISATGGGCVSEPSVSVNVSGGGISSVSVTNVGVGCSSVPTFSTSSIPGLTGGSITAILTPLRTGIHPRTLTDAAGNTVDANGVVAAYLQNQFTNDLALP